MPADCQARDVGTESDVNLCGESFDHDEEVTYEDGAGYQWTCRRCGAEGWEDADE